MIEDVDGNYKMFGYLEVTGKMGTNTLTSGLRGPCNIVFKDGQHIRFGFPFYKLGGTLYGERSIEVLGSSTYEDLTNNRKAVVIFNTHKKAGWFSGKESGNKTGFEGLIYDSYSLSGDDESIK